MLGEKVMGEMGRFFLRYFLVLPTEDAKLTTAECCCCCFNVMGESTGLRSVEVSKVGFFHFPCLPPVNRGDWKG